ncbi:hypothetical protein HDU77_000667 [Chytriomyces hyalinus]|nr:hypothetical protein HDU77_000667 [Chytriomyces hyalinus]
MVHFTIQTVVKKYKSQHNDSALILPTEEFQGDAAAFKARLWAIAESHIKGTATVVDNTAEIDQERPSINDFSNFIVVSKNSRSYSFAGNAPVLRPLVPIKESQMSTLASGDEVVQVVICIYGRKIAKASDYAKVMTLVQGGENATDRSGAPNQARIDSTVQRLCELHPHLTGGNLIWRYWAATLLRSPDTLSAAISQPPPPQITLLFQRQFFECRQLQEIQTSLTLARDIAEDSR